jgi:rhamnosyltransferase
MVFSQKIDKKYEVIVIDSGSVDSSLEIVKGYPAKIFEVKPDEFGHGRTRNFGAGLAKGEFIVFLNADAMPMDEHWLSNLLKSFNKDEGIVAAHSRIYPRKDCNPLRAWEILNDSNYIYDETRIKYIDNLAIYNKIGPREKRKLVAFESISCAIRKDFLLEYPFNGLDFGEDLEWGKRMIEKGFKIAFKPDSKVLHSHNFYHSFIATFRKYFVDARLNQKFFNMWSLRDLPLLLVYTGYKIWKDMKYIISLDRDIIVKIIWLFYSPIIRMAEFSGIIFGCWAGLVYENHSSRP